MTVVVVGSHKGGAGKSTLAIHILACLSRAGVPCALIDADVQQKTAERFFRRRENLDEASTPLKPFIAELPPAQELKDTPYAPSLAERFVLALSQAQAVADYIVIDMPAGQSPLAKPALIAADLLITPVNDSLVDLEVIRDTQGQPGRFGQLVRAVRNQRSADRPLRWTILRNRVSPLFSNNAQRVHAHLETLVTSDDLTIGPSIGERVGYRDMFDSGHTVIDQIDTGSETERRQRRPAWRELHQLMSFAGLPSPFRAAADGAASS